MATPLGIKFWGTRGLVSAPGKGNIKYGGNTSCAQILFGDSLVVIDAGFGISNLGEHLLKIGNKEPVHILFTHMHWDHIQGLPFFHPIYFPETELNLYSPLPPEDLKKSLDVLFDGSYSPFEGIDSMPATINFRQIVQPLTVTPNLDVSAVQVHHGSEHDGAGQTWGYRFNTPNNSIAFITDHEAEPQGRNKPVVEFCKGVDLLVHDAQYTEDEYPQHVGWGHSTPAMAVANALSCGAKELLMTHHDPGRSDFQLDVMSRKYRTSSIKVSFAKENHDYWIKALAKKKQAG